jgi:hypothetical protein
MVDAVVELLRHGVLGDIPHHQSLRVLLGLAEARNQRAPTFWLIYSYMGI